MGADGVGEAADAFAEPDGFGFSVVFGFSGLQDVRRREDDGAVFGSGGAFAWVVAGCVLCPALVMGDGAKELVARARPGFAVDAAPLDKPAR